jgi:alpha-ketoglutarate-dependent taurine dioxygenase
LRNRVEGGSSYFVDSFAAAFDYLSDLPAKEAGKEAYPSIEFEYDNDGHYLYNIHHMIPKEKRYLDNVKTAVNWSPPFQGMPTQASVGNDPEAQLKWYKAVDKFQKILEQPQREWEFTMEEGDLVLFDNRRVLHARRAFRDLTEAEREERGVEVIEGESSRWLKGCYLDGEVVWDKLATLNRDVNGFSQ